MGDWDESEHPRHPAEAPGGHGGEFRAAVDLRGLSRAALLRHARERGLSFPRGTSDTKIRNAIKRHDERGPDWAEKVAGQIETRRPTKSDPRKEVAKLEAKLAILKGRLGLAQDKRRRASGAKIATAAESKLRAQITEVRRQISALRGEAE
jgi:hypothetical protein